jgi:hypothetical protein
MVLGRIEGFYTASKGHQKSVIKILVTLNGLEETNRCTVCAEVPNDALAFDMVKADAPIGWDEKNVYITIEGVEDIAFKKVGKTSEDEVTFYEHLKSNNQS